MAEFTSQLSRAIYSKAIHNDSQQLEKISKSQKKLNNDNGDNINKFIRDNYLKLINCNDEKKILEEFRNIAHDLINAEKIEDESIKGTSKSLSIEKLEEEAVVYSKDKTIYTKDKYIMIGRDNRFCSIIFSEQAISRIHVILFFTENNVYIVDPGSAYGILINDKIRSIPLDKKYSDTLDKSFTKNIFEKEYSRVIRFPRTEPIKVNIVGKEIIVNPKTCLICMTSPRIVKLECDHVVYCEECFKKRYNNLCPLCRKSFTEDQHSLTNPFQTIAVYR